MLIGCSKDEINNDNNDTMQSCGVIVSTGEDKRGDFIEVRMPYHNVSEKDRYKVVDYSKYKLNAEICDFDGLTKEPL